MRKNKIFQFLINLKSVSYIAIFLLLNSVIYLFAYLLPSNSSQNDVEDSLTTIYEKIGLGVIVVPIIETLLFQSLIISVICYLIKRPKYNLYASIFISATAFSLSHSYNIYYIIMTFLTGTTLAFAYYIARYRKFNATITIILIHAIWNLFSFITD